MQILLTEAEYTVLKNAATDEARKAEIGVLFGKTGPYLSKLSGGKFPEGAGEIIRSI